jgi:hypothetical protein
MGVLILGAVLLQALAGVGLLVAALAKAAAWGWRPTMARQDGRWPVARMMLAGGAVLLTLAVLQAAVLVAYVYVVAATSYAQ